MYTYTYSHPLQYGILPILFFWYQHANPNLKMFMWWQKLASDQQIRVRCYYYYYYYYYYYIRLMAFFPGQPG